MAAAPTVWFLMGLLTSPGTMTYDLNPPAVSYSTQALCLAAAQNPPAGLIKIWNDKIPPVSVGGTIGLACVQGYSATIAP